MKNDLVYSIKEAKAKEEIIKALGRAPGDYYKIDRNLDSKIIEFLAQAKTISIEQYWIKIETNFFRMTLWNENKPFGWLVRGNVEDLFLGKIIFEWEEKIPSLQIFWKVHEITELVKEERYYLETSKGL